MKRSDPAVLLVAAGEGAEEALEHARRIAGMLVAVQPVVLTDVNHAPGAASEGVLVEHLVPLEVWTRSRPPADWGPYVAQRVAASIDEHEPVAVVALTPLPEAQGLSAILSPIVLRSMPSSESNLIA